MVTVKEYGKKWNELRERGTTNSITSHMLEENGPSFQYMNTGYFTFDC